MLNTKEMVSGKDIDLSKYNLGVIRQPKIDDFMGELDLIDFVKPFYMERVWRVNGLFDENDFPFTLFCASVSKNHELEILLMIALRMIYIDKVIVTAEVDDSIKILVCNNVFELDKNKSRAKINKKYKDVYKINIKNEPIAFIDDSNFDMLCRVIVGMMYFEEPKPEKKEEYKGNPELVELVKRLEAEEKLKEKNKNETPFEEKVREVIHMKNCFYDDIKNLTVWQLEDFYRSCMFMDNYNKNYQLASSGNFKIKEIKNWQSQTKISRDAE